MEHRAKILKIVSECLQFRKTELIRQLEPQLQNAKIGSKIQNLKTTIATTAPSETFLKEHKCVMDKPSLHWSWRELEGVEGVDVTIISLKAGRSRDKTRQGSTFLRKNPPKSRMTVKPPSSSSCREGMVLLCTQVANGKSLNEGNGSNLLSSVLR